MVSPVECTKTVSIAQKSGFSCLLVTYTVWNGKHRLSDQTLERLLHLCHRDSTGSSVDRTLCLGPELHFSERSWLGWAERSQGSVICAVLWLTVLLMGHQLDVLPGK